MTTSPDRSSTVLAIDDEEDILGFLSTLLGTRGFRVLTARSGPEGIDVARQERPDVILLDIMMPDMDGHEVCRRLKADPVTSRIPVLMLTAMNRIKDIALAMDEGADGFMAKPFENRNLLEVVAHLTTPGEGMGSFYVARKPGAAPMRRVQDVERGHAVVLVHAIEDHPVMEGVGSLPGAYLVSLFADTREGQTGRTVGLVEIEGPEALGEVLNLLTAEGAQVTSCRVFRDIMEVPFDALPRSEHNV